jgi:hypothetical protein
LKAQIINYWDADDLLPMEARWGLVPVSSPPYSPQSADSDPVPGNRPYGKQAVSK